MFSKSVLMFLNILKCSVNQFILTANIGHRIIYLSVLRLKNNCIIIIYRNAVSLTNNELFEKQEKHFKTFSWKSHFIW